ncbi:MFS transporter [Thermococcus sp. 18S1]|uniref:MFS transporter n=1 Tax=Thermococcus sp. 18S1 TaxID=1638210 RepID=UPI00143CAA65|nr:MFS transporter [Thermococcus sp. 18S1]NJE30626.1 MFS transporter [Thermococcus sp. 18S1]
MASSKWGVLIVMSAAIFIITIDTTMMNVSISAIVKDLNTTVNGVQGAITLYALVMAAFMIPGAKLADIWGTKKVFFRGLVIYTIGTLMAAFSPTIEILVLGWSILEGIGAAMMMPATVTYVTKAYTGKDRAFAFASWGAVNGAAAAFGPIIGGFFTTYVTWRLGFFMEAFIAAAIFAYLKILPNYKPEKQIKLDVVGSVLIGSALFLLTLSVFLINPLGEEPVAALMILGIALVLLFWKYEQRLRAKGKDVVFDIDVFKSRTFTVATMISLFFQMSIAGLLFIIPVFLQAYLGYNALRTGFILLPLSVTLFIVSMGGKYFARIMTPKRVLQLGIALSFVGFYLLFRAFRLDVTGMDLIPGLAFYGMGIGMVISEITNLAMMGAKPEQQADASGILNTQRQFGYSLGTALIGAVLVIGVINSITRQIYESGIFEGASRAQIRDAVIEWIIRMEQGDLQIPPEYHEVVKHMVNTAFIDSMKTAMLFTMFILLISGLLSFLLPKGEKIEASSEPETANEQENGE